MKLTLDEAWENCLKMWDLYSQRWDNFNGVHKEEILKEMGVTEHILNYCFFCEYDTNNQGGCRSCPLTEFNTTCHKLGYDYSDATPKKFYNKLIKLNNKRKGKMTEIEIKLEQNRIDQERLKEEQIKLEVEREKKAFYPCGSIFQVDGINLLLAFVDGKVLMICLDNGMWWSHGKYSSTGTRSVSFSEIKKLINIHQEYNIKYIGKITNENIKNLFGE